MSRLYAYEGPHSRLAQSSHPPLDIAYVLSLPAYPHARCTISLTPLVLSPTQQTHALTQYVFVVASPLFVRCSLSRTGRCTLGAQVRHARLPFLILTYQLRTMPRVSRTLGPTIVYLAICLFDSSPTFIVVIFARTRRKVLHEALKPLASEMHLRAWAGPILVVIAPL